MVVSVPSGECVKVVHRFVYAVPAGLIDRPPVGADQRSGLVWVYPDGRVEWKRKCKINHSPEALPQLTAFNPGVACGEGRGAVVLEAALL